MALRALVLKFSDMRKRSGADACASAEPQEERKTMPVQQPRPRRRKPLDAGPFAPEIGSFRLHLAAQGKAPKTVRKLTRVLKATINGPSKIGSRRQADTRPRPRPWK